MVRTKTLYNYIDQGLVRQLKTRRRVRKTYSRKNKRVFGTSIEQRPEHIEHREEFGHGEIDTFIVNDPLSRFILTLTVRKTRQELLFFIGEKVAKQEAIVS